MQQASSDLSPTIIVIFGITGDLSKRYLLPALYHLFKEQLLHPDTEIVGISRRALHTRELLSHVEVCVNETDGTCDKKIIDKLHSSLRMHQMNPVNPEDYDGLLKLLNDIEASKGMCMNRLYYLSIPPQVYGPIVKLMGQAKLNGSCPHGIAMTRLLIEKPFGYDLVSARALITETSEVFSETQLFRIDHYLAKETVQNILTFRFENPVFEALWSREHIDRIVISASEQLTVKGREEFYEKMGALRDFIQSHLLQLLAIVTMDQPKVMDSEHIHEKKREVLSLVAPVAADQVINEATRGQYEGYREEVGNSDSEVETFAGIRVTIDNDRWRNVPISIWTGKALHERKTEICVSFKGGGEQPNHLRFRIQPNEGIELDLTTKKPGYATEVQTTAMDFSYKQSFGESDHPTAYERVLLDAIRGDHTLFATGDEVISAWRIVQPVLDEWAKITDGIAVYRQGTDGSELAQPILV